MFKISNDATELNVAADFFTDAQLAYIWKVKQAAEFAEGLRITLKPKNNVKTKKVSQIN